MKLRWNYKDIIDLAYFQNRDEDAEPDELHQRDRKIYREVFEDDSSLTDDQIIKTWLRKRTADEFSDETNRSPGRLFSDVHILACTLIIIVGIVSGVGAGLSFFHYSGTTPINVFQFLLVFVFSQILLTCFLISSLFIRKIRSKKGAPSFYRFFFGRLLKRGADLLSRQWSRHLPGKKRLSFNHAMGIVTSHGKLYGSLFYWLFFNLAQIFALSFNGGLLAATLLKISTNDLAFGWQSTLQFSAASLYKLISLLALPWSWFIPPSLAYPSLEQIEGSRILLKEGIYMLATENLVSWWPFLIFCLLFYGLFFRLLCYLAGKVMEKRALNRNPWRSAASQRTVQRMTTPLFSTQAGPEQEKLEEENHGPVSSAPSDNSRTYPQTVLVADDIAPLFPETKIQNLLRKHGFTPRRTTVFMADYDTDRKIVQELGEESRDNQTGLFLLVEGWMVPLTDFLTYLQELRKSLPR